MRDTEITIVTRWAVDVRHADGWHEVATMSSYQVATQLVHGLLDDGRGAVRVRDLTTGKIPFSVEG